MSIIKCPVGIQTFEKIRTDNYLYVDKTKYIYNLVTKGTYYFLSRPRRFGKSLTMTTIKALFEGRRDLFKGLAIDSLEWDWQHHEVLHLDLNVRYYKDEVSLVTILERHLRQWEAKYDIKQIADTPEDRFVEVIQRSHIIKFQGRRGGPEIL